MRGRRRRCMGAWPRAGPMQGGAHLWDLEPKGVHFPGPELLQDLLVHGRPNDLAGKDWQRRRGGRRRGGRCAGLRRGRPARRAAPRPQGRGSDALTQLHAPFAVQHPRNVRECRQRPRAPAGRRKAGSDVSTGAYILVYCTAWAGAHRQSGADRRGSAQLSARARASDRMPCGGRLSTRCDALGSAFWRQLPHVSAWRRL